MTHVKNSATLFLHVFKNNPKSSHLLLAFLQATLSLAHSREGGRGKKHGWLYSNLLPPFLNSTETKSVCVACDNKLAWFCGWKVTKWMNMVMVVVNCSIW